MKQIFINALEMMMQTAPTAVASVRIGSGDAMRGLKHTARLQSELDVMAGQKAPERMALRVFAGDVDEVKNGRTVYVDDVAWTVENITPDSVGAVIVLDLIKQRIAG